MIPSSSIMASTAYVSVAGVGPLARTEPSGSRVQLERLLKAVGRNAESLSGMSPPRP